MVPVRIECRLAGFEPSDPYVRRFWVAAIGSSAVAELLRLVRAAEKGEGVRLPRTLPALLRVGLVKAETSGLVVFDRIPPVPLELRWRFPPSLASEHSRWKLPLDCQQSHEHEGNALTDRKSERDTKIRFASESDQGDDRSHETAEPGGRHA